MKETIYYTDILFRKIKASDVLPGAFYKVIFGGSQFGAE